MPRYVVKTYVGCERCALHLFRRHVVFGRGSVPANVLFVGEAPGRSEDLLGEPFVGPSGRILNAAIEEATHFAGMKTPPSFYITNIVGCRPTDGLHDPNREPTQEEAWACWPRLEQTFRDISPQVVVLLGKAAHKAVGKAFPDAVRLQHPAFILRTGAQESPSFIPFCRDLSEVFRRCQKPCTT